VSLTCCQPEVRSVEPSTTGGDEWNRVVNEVDQSTLAHSPEWFTIIHHAYGHEPLYLSAEDEEGRRGVLPAFIVRRPLLGTVVTSMPFLDSGGPCSSSTALSTTLVEHLIVHARGFGADVVELRCAQKLRVDWPAMEHKVSLRLPLAGDPDRLWRQFDGSLRNQIRKAERSGLSVEFGNVDKLDAFYDTFAIRMRDLGSPVHAAGFLRAVVEAFGSRSRIVLVRKNRTPVGGLIALTFKDTVVVPWAACLKEYFSLCPNMLLYWETLRAACIDGVGSFDFGRSTRHSGTYRFKVQWGAREEPLFWYTIPVSSRRNRTAGPDGRRALLLTNAWRRLPLAITRRLGPAVRRYLTQ
jgi:FemAB-related protein (PEP-CTERM system-associated)